MLPVLVGLQGRHGLTLIRGLVTQASDPGCRSWPSQERPRRQAAGGGAALAEVAQDTRSCLWHRFEPAPPAPAETPYAPAVAAPPEATPAALASAPGMTAAGPPAAVTTVAPATCTAAVLGTGTKDR